MIIKESKNVRHIAGRLERGDEVPAKILEVCEKYQIKAGFFSAIGGFEELQVSEYSIEMGRYRDPIEMRRMLEIIQLSGNISMKDGEPFTHLHTVCSYRQGEGENLETKILAGHLISGKVFVCEFHITVFDDIELARKVEPKTNLPLWKG